MSTTPAGSAPAPEPAPRDGAPESPVSGAPADAVPEATAEPGADDAPVSAARRRRLVTWTFVLAALVLLVDQLTKWWAESALVWGADPRPLVGELLQLRLIYNDGAALSIATGMTWILTIVVCVVVVVIVRAIRRIGSTGWAVALGLLLGGALGNLGDRFFREPGFARGHVVDFIDYGVFVGNVADIAIVAAAVLIVVLSFRGIGLDGQLHTDGAERQAAESEAVEPAADEER
ncbi:signal peptidase II [Krasilnikoviella flava]|uniref:Lipoprotein signal peptidase n=1 Tax=Krasilnikoviella flava TaxID=526729 RepID=A0A1T5LUK5_9MICO|nr:signal peptidase II [Krasilnikoviella flava]SKC79524.1 signal peptidase II [Krasilnikoviella flava]